MLRHCPVYPLAHNPKFERPRDKRPFEDSVEKAENSGNQHFLLFPQCFLPFQTQTKTTNLDIYL